MNAKGRMDDISQFVRERGEIDEWLNFFLSGIAGQATDARTRSDSWPTYGSTTDCGCRKSEPRIEVADLLSPIQS